MEHVYLAGFDFGATSAFNAAKELGKDKVHGLLLLDGLYLTLAADKEFELDVPMLTINSLKSTSSQDCGQTGTNGLLKNSQILDKMH